MQIPNTTLPDLLRDALTVVFVGINPSLYSVAQGHYFARRSNRFWPCFSRSVLSDAARQAFGVERLEPEHDQSPARARLRLHRPGQTPHRTRQRSCHLAN